ncbi:MAG: DUF805 domain-containing protein [Chloroflexota bacterium]|nr:DUF805 domain-containing protein [Chloroflexota bacterium]
MPQSVGQCLRKYAAFSGRATRAEFWWWALACYLAIVVLTVFDGVLTAFLVALGVPFFSPLGLLLAAGVFLPSLAVAVRRLHDIGKSGWWLLVWYAIQLAASLAMLVSVFVLLFLPVFGAMGGNGFLEDLKGSSGALLIATLLVVSVSVAAMALVGVWALVWLARQGERFPNRYGEDPRAWNTEASNAGDMGLP